MSHHDAYLEPPGRSEEDLEIRQREETADRAAQTLADALATVVVHRGERAVLVQRGRCRWACDRETWDMSTSQWNYAGKDPLDHLFLETVVLAAPLSPKLASRELEVKVALGLVEDKTLSWRDVETIFGLDVRAVEVAEVQARGGR